MSDLSPLQSLKSSALKLLAMREHSRTELREKLSRKCADEPFLELLLAQLEEDGLQSDRRFAEAFVAMRQRQGKGPVLLKMELKQKGVSADLIAELLDEQDDCWLISARNQRSKKFGQSIPSEAKERARQMRFLQARGFSSGQIRLALAGGEFDF